MRDTHGKYVIDVLGSVSSGALLINVNPMLVFL